MKQSRTIVRDTLKGKSSYTLDTLTHKYEYYCCPLCSSLPEILCYNQGSGTVKIKCKTHGEKTLEIEEYMKKMAFWEKDSELRLKNKCEVHNEKFAFYCQACEENYCKKCSNKHEKHTTYNLNSLLPNKQEILYINNIIEMLLQKKDELEKMMKILDHKITFYDTLVQTHKNQYPNYLLNINLKHLVYGEKLNFDEIQNTEFVYDQSQRELYDDFIQNKFIKATEGLNQLNLIDQNMKNELIESVFKGIEENTIYDILKSSGKVKEPSEIINLKNIKILNLRGNKLTSLNFISNKNFPFLEILSLNDNEINSINNLKSVSFPLLKELYLAKNKIENIDVLAELKTPNLTILWLANNNITSIDIFEKVNFPNLLKLSLSKNQIKNINVFSKNRAKLPQLYELYLNDNEFEINNFSKIIDSLFLKIKQFYY